MFLFAVSSVTAALHINIKEILFKKSIVLCRCESGRIFILDDFISVRPSPGAETFEQQNRNFDVSPIVQTLTPQGDVPVEHHWECLVHK
jgi:hypothetical protein